MFFLFEALPVLPIHVTVLQPPAPPGLPEWAKTLLSAGIGAVFGVVTSILMEYVKPWIAKQQLRKTVETQLGQEMMNNLLHVESGDRIFRQASEKNNDEAREEALTYARVVIRQIEHDRYDFYFGNQKNLVYEIDETKTLSAFYAVVRDGLPHALKSGSFEDSRKFLTMAAVLGKNYVQLKKMVYLPGATVLETAFHEIDAHKTATSPASENYLD